MDAQWLVTGLKTSPLSPWHILRDATLPSLNLALTGGTYHTPKRLFTPSHLNSLISFHKYFPCSYGYLDRVIIPPIVSSIPPVPFAGLKLYLLHSVNQFSRRGSSCSAWHPVAERCAEVMSTEVNMSTHTLSQEAARSCVPSRCRLALQGTQERWWVKERGERFYGVYPDSQ